MTAQSVQLDSAGAVRAGEELDVAKVDAYLKQHIVGLEGRPPWRSFPVAHRI